MGRRTAPLINDPVPDAFEESTDFVELPSAEGGRAVPEEAVEALEAVLDPKDFAEDDFTGE